MPIIRNLTNTRKLPRILHPKYAAETDFTITSIDFVQFNVDKETILRHSPVIRQVVSDAEGIGQASKGIMFVTNGHSNILESFVRLCYGGPLETPEPQYAWRICEEHSSLALLLRELKASQLYFKLIQQIYRWIMDKQLAAWYFFSFADKANLPDIATCAIAHGQAMIWPAGDRCSDVTQDGEITNEPFWGAIGSIDIMDPTAMSVQSFFSLSDKYMYGLCRAMRSSPRPSPYEAKSCRDTTCWKSVASDFQEIMRNFEHSDGTNIGRRRPPESYTQKNLRVKYQFDDSDLTIITSDGVKLGIHRDILNHTSSTFKDVLACPQVQPKSAAELELTDTEIETSGTVKLFLAFLYNPVDIKSPASENVREFADLIRFCLKYDASDVLDNIRTYLYLWNSIGSVSFADVFLVACYMDDLPLMVAAFSNPNNTWGGGTVRTDHTTRNTSLESIEGAPMFDLTAAPFEWFVQLPMDIRWSLLRGTRGSFFQPLNGQRWLRAGTEFESCVKRIRAYRSGSFKNENGSKEKS